MWLFNWFVPLKRSGHELHWNVFSRCVILWPLRDTSVLNSFPHTSHLKFFLSEWTALCLCKVPEFAYFFGHFLHLKGFSSFSSFFLKPRFFTIFHEKDWLSKKCEKNIIKSTEKPQHNFTSWNPDCCYKPKPTMHKTQLTRCSNEWFSKEQHYIGTLIDKKTDNEQMIWNFHFPNQ